MADIAQALKKRTESAAELQHEIDCLTRIAERFPDASIVTIDDELGIEIIVSPSALAQADKLRFGGRADSASMTVGDDVYVTPYVDMGMPVYGDKKPSFFIGSWAGQDRAAVIPKSGWEIEMRLASVPEKIVETIQKHLLENPISAETRPFARFRLVPLSVGELAAEES